ncbi:MAG: hypothetical protein H7318_18395 [Oligoflexus sp.]|nr:hypothetical protein [Oligoflexus sp.]
MILLVVDTSLQGLTVGLVQLDGKAFDILEIYGSNQPQEAAARLPELCQGLLSKQKLSLSEVTDLLISKGPGSFTGIKIGLSFASGWKRAGTPIKIWGVSSFRALLKQLPDVHTLVLPATQTAGYFTHRDQISPSSSSRFGVFDLSHSAVISIIDSGTEGLTPMQPKDLGQVSILGRWPRVEEWLSAQGSKWNTLDTEGLHHSIVSSMVEDFVANSDQLSEGNLVPIYLRKSAPEEKLDSAKAKN